MRTLRRRFIPLLALVVGVGWALSCGDTAHNDFGQTLQFNGFFTDETCGMGLSAAQVFLSSGAADEVVALQVENRTTGTFIPGGGGGGGTLVPGNEGVRILLKNIHIEYKLPVGFIPPRDWVVTRVVDPLGEFCIEFFILQSEDTNNMIQDPLSYPPVPFHINVRATVQGVTEGGLNIETSGDLLVIVD